MIVDMKDPRIVSWIKAGKVFVYPTDTVYGIGCDARNQEAVDRIRNIKGSKKPWSVIVPSKDWVKEHCKPGEELEKLPGPFTFIYSTEFNLACNNNSNSVGVRIPKHPFSKIVELAGVPFVTTSLNKTGEEPIISLAQMPLEIYNKVDVVIDLGAIKGKPSTVIDYRQDPPKILRA
tara:strand:- start:146 stop:673 length:528 start_codon:yes stop_codon:yes gene_type:complete